MSKKFHERFDIECSLEEAKQKFINRACNDIFDYLRFRDRDTYEHVYLPAAATAVGARYQWKIIIEKLINDDFLSCLSILEAVNNVFFEETGATVVNQRISQLVESSEVDLDIKWANGVFVRKGAEELDERLVNSPLKWLRDKNYENVLNPFQKGLEHLLQSSSNQKLRYDVTTDMYEAVEALSQIVTGRSDKDLSANRELFLSEIRASDAYKPILKDYISYANNFRHAFKEGNKRPTMSEAECESFVYLTGLFIRLVIESEKL